MNHELTNSRREVFLSELAKHGRVTAAADTAGLDRSHLYKRKNDDPIFAEQWAAAIDRFADTLEEAARLRAVEGTDKGIYHQGVLMATEKQYSDSLLALMLKAKRKREYGDSSKVELTGADGGALKVEQSPTEIARSIAFALALGLRAKEQQAAVEPADGSDLA